MLVVNNRVAVTGMGILCALGDTFELVFANMKAEVTGIGQISRFPTERFHSGLGAELTDFHASEYFTQEELNRYDLCSQYAIVAAMKALQDSGLSDSGMDVYKTGIALGTCNGGILSLEQQWTISDLDRATTAKYPFYQQADHVAAHLRLSGPVVTLNTACAASGNAIGYGFDMIRWGYADRMLVGGSDPMSHSVYAGFNVLRALNPQPTSPFSDQFGLSLGEGAAFVVLEPLERALSRGAPVYAEICGYGLSNDAFHETSPEPEGKGIQVAVEMALAQSSINRERIDYINAHGTGTQANDQAEITGLRGVFEDRLSEIPISSSKAYFGHNLGAAAAIEFATSLYAIRQGYLPATLHYEQPREGCDNIHIIANHMQQASPTYMLNNNSAFGGHNASIVAKVGQLDDTHQQGMQSTCSSRRIGIVGIGSVMGSGVRKGGIPAVELLPDDAEGKKGSCSFSLKDYEKSLYERRMNRLCQFSIGSVKLALEDAGWMVDEQSGSGLGFIYGTSRGSTESIGKFLNSVFANGPEYASSIYFPFTVINSISGKTAQKLHLKGFSSSLSTGGTEGATAAMYACGIIQEGVHERVLVASGDEFSELSDKIDEARGLDGYRYHGLEGSVCLALSDLDAARRDGLNVYAEITGFGTGFAGAESKTGSGEALTQAIRDSIKRARIDVDQVDGLILNTIGHPDDVATQEGIIGGLFPGRGITSLNDQYGYGESLSSILPLGLAAESIAQGHHNHILTVSCSLNGNIVATIISRFLHD